MEQYIKYNGEECEVLEIVNRSARIATSKGEKIILVPKDYCYYVGEQETKAGQEQESAIDFEGMTKAELIEYADAHGIKVGVKMKKAEIIDAIKAGE